MAQRTVPAAKINTVHHGDCIAGMNALPAGSIDLVFADPPFNIGYDYDVYHDAKGYNEYLDWSRNWIGAVHRVLKPDGTFWLAIGDEYAAELKIEAQKLGFHTRSWVIWYYTFGVNCKAKFSRSHAHLFHFVKDRERFTFRSDELENRIPSARLLVYGDSRGNPNGRLPDDTWILRPQDLSDRFTADEDTWYFPRVAGTFKERAGFHGCQMPEQLLGRIIRLCSDENEIVLDPFSGSATTLVVAKKLKRRFLGFDLSADYVERGRERLRNVCIGEALEGAAEPTMSAPVTVASRPDKTGQKESALESILRASEESQGPKARAMYLRGLIEAFRRASDGFSLDRVIADPELNQRLNEECQAAGLPGDIRWWNRTLLRARKAGELAGVTKRGTDLSWQDCDPFLFASEIAWKTLLDEGCESLDDIFCDPQTAARFDDVAARFAPGFRPFDYRWAALKLRKEAKKARDEARTICPGPFRAPFAPPLDAHSERLADLPETSGVYLISGRQRKRILYAGEALALRSRVERQLAAAGDWGGDLEVRFFTAEPRARLLLAYQYLCIDQHEPLHNLRSAI